MVAPVRLVITLQRYGSLLTSSKKKKDLRKHTIIHLYGDTVFIPCDRKFGFTKKKLRRIDRVYMHEEYNKCISEAS